MAEPTRIGAPAMDNPLATTLEFGGLRFDISFDHRGATMSVSGLAGGEWTEMLRFDDFIDSPHFHAPPPPARAQIAFDRTALGEPLAWYVVQVRDHLPEWLERAGFAGVLETIDLAEVARNTDKLTEAMFACVPEGCVRVPGIGLQRLETSA